MNTQELSKVCRQVRRDIITMTANAGSGHPGGSLSAVELMTSVFFNHMRVDPSNPHDPDRDRFVLSKGHAAPCYYAVLAAKGFISRDEYANFRQLHSILQGHPDAKKVPGVDASTGSLGQGVSIAVGMALGAKHLGKDTKVFALVGENGPELVYFNGGEQVMTAEETAAMRESMEIQAVTFAPQLLEALHAIHGDGALSAEPGAGSGAGSVELQIVFQINGGASPETVEALREYGDEFAERVLEVMEEAGIDTARRAYK